MATKPAPRMARLTSIPGLGSASRADPIGISGDAAMATATAITAPATVTAATRTMDRATSRPRVMPRTRRIGNSAASMISWRLSSWPTTASMMSAARAANTASATASGRMARSVAVTSSDRLTMLNAPAGMWSRRATAAAAPRNAVMLAPGRSRNPVWMP